MNKKKTSLGENTQNIQTTLKYNKKKCILNLNN